MANVRIHGDLVFEQIVDGAENPIVTTTSFTYSVSWTDRNGDGWSRIFETWPDAVGHVIGQWPNMPDWHPDRCVCESHKVVVNVVGPWPQNGYVR